MKSIVRRALFAACLFSSVPVFGQSPAQVLAYFEGTWVGKTKYEGMSKPMDVPIDSSIKGVLAVGRKYLQMETTIFIPGEAEETMTLLTFDPRMGLFRAWTFNAHTAGDHVTSGVPQSDPNTIKLASPGVIMNGGNTAYQEILHIDTHNQFTLTYQVRHHDATTHTDVWGTVYSSIYTRKDAAK